MAYPSQGERVERKFMVPVELDDWLRRTARPNGDRSVCPVGRTQNDLAVAGLYLLRELLDGIPSEVSQRLLDDAASLAAVLEVT